MNDDPVEQNCSEDTKKEQDTNGEKIVKLVFERYGLTFGTQKGSFNLPSDPNVYKSNKKIPEDGFTSKAPKLDDYNYCKKPLRKGFLYIYNETVVEDKKDAEYQEFYEVYECAEYQVNYCPSSAKLQYIKNTWKNDTNNEILDVRTPVEPPPPKRSYICARLKDTIWVAFSHIHLSAECVKVLFSKEGKSNDNVIDRKKRFQKINIKDWLTFRYGDDNIDHFFEKSEKNLIYPEKKTEKDSEKEPEPEFKLTKDSNSCIPKLFFNINDPLGAAGDICKDINVKVGKFKELINSIQTSNEDEALTPTFIGEASFLYRQALMLYHLFFSNEKLPSDTPTDKQKAYNTFLENKKYIVQVGFLEKLLGVEKRKNNRNEINKRRSNLLKFIDSDYYYNVLVDFQKNITDHRSEGIKNILYHIQTVCFEPSNLDQDIDITETKNSELNEKVGKFISKIYTDKENEKIENNAIHKVFTEPVNLDKLRDEFNKQQKDPNLKIKDWNISPSEWEKEHIQEFYAQANSAISNLHSIGTAFAKDITTIAAVGNNPVFYSNHFLKSEDAKKFFQIVASESAGGKTQVLFRIEDPKALKDYLSSKGLNLAHVTKLPGQTSVVNPNYVSFVSAELQNVNISGGVSNYAVKVEAGKVNILDKIVNGQHFLNICGLLSTLNLFNTIRYEKPGQFWTKQVNQAAAMVEVVYYITRSVHLYHDISFSTATKLQKIAGKYLTNIAIALSGVATLLDAYYAQQQGNRKFGYALYTSGILSIVGAGIAGVGYGVGGAIGSAAAIASGILFVIAGIIMILAYFIWYKTRFEIFFSNCMLSQKASDDKLWKEIGVSDWNALELTDFRHKLMNLKNKIVSDNELIAFTSMRYSYLELLSFFSAPHKIDVAFVPESEIAWLKGAGIAWNPKYFIPEKSDVNEFARGYKYAYFHCPIKTVTILLNPPNFSGKKNFEGGLMIFHRDNNGIAGNLNFTNYTLKTLDDKIEVTFDLTKISTMLHRNSKTYFYYHFVMEDGSIYPGGFSYKYFTQIIHRYDEYKADCQPGQPWMAPKLQKSKDNKAKNDEDYKNRKNQVICSLDDLLTLNKPK